MRALFVAAKNLRELSRERMLLLLVLLLPAAFLAINYFAYGVPYQATYKIFFSSSYQEPESLSLWDLLASAKYDDGRPQFELKRMASRKEALSRLIDKEAVGLLELGPPKEQGTAPTVRWFGDGSELKYSNAGARIGRVLARYAVHIARAHPKLIRTGAADPVVQMVTKPLGRGTPRSMFETLVPGMILFSVLLLIPQTALLAAREARVRTLERLRLTRMTALDYLGGLTLSQLVVAAIQLSLVLLLAKLFGFQNHGSTLMALLILMVAAFSSVGFGMLVACVIEDDSQATNVGAAVTMIQVLLSGVFFAMPTPTIATVAGHQLGVFAFLPATHAMMALQQVMCFGANASAVLFRVGLLALLSLALFAIGVATFQRLKMRNAVR